MDVASQIAANLASVRERMAAACARAGRDPADVTLVAVTKSTSVDAIRALRELGERDFGENRPQQLLDRAPQLPGNVRWHQIGTLQRNKARKIVVAAAWIHAVDSLRLLEALDRLARELGVRPQLLLEVNVSGEATKHGFDPLTLRSEWPSIERCESVDVRGLMTMAPQSDDPEAARPTFRALRELRDELRDRSPHRTNFDRLSMGMTGDFEPAIEEGATFVRIGSALFAGVAESPP